MTVMHECAVNIVWEFGGGVERLSSNTAVICVSCNKCWGLPFHGEEGNCPKEPNHSHNQELPLKKQVVAVEIGYGCTDRLKKRKGGEFSFTDIQLY